MNRRIERAALYLVFAMAAETPLTARVMSILRTCNEATGKAGRPYRYT